MRMAPLNMAALCASMVKRKYIESHPPRCNPGEYPKNPAYANVPQNVLNMPHAPPVGAGPMAMGMGTPGLMTGRGNEGVADAMAVGYLMGHGDMGMLGGIDGGPQVAIGGTYHGMM